MMEELSCIVCRIEYNENDKIPKVLPCGHSVCNDCLDKIISANPLCPKCRTALRLDIKSSNEYPTNFALLGISSANGSMNLLKCHLQCRLETLKRKLIEKKDSLTKRKTQICSELELIKNGLSRLEAFILAEVEDINLTEANSVLREIEEDFAKVRKRSTFNYVNFRINVTISVNNFNKPNDYLDAIYESLLNGEELYSISMHDNALKYGKITMQNNMIIVHALCLSSLPENVAAVWFDDFKMCASKENFLAFLKISCNNKGINRTIKIKMLDSSLVSQFIRLCTGESDVMYKGCHFIRGEDSSYFQSILEVKGYMAYGLQKKGGMDYGVNSSVNTQININDIVLIGNADGTFQIGKCTYGTTFSNVIGKIDSPINLPQLISYDSEGAESLMVVDSGIVFEF